MSLIQSLLLDENESLAQNSRQLKSKVKIVLKILLILFFSLAFFSIPTCSFSSKFYYLTWIFTFLFIIVAFLILFFFYSFKIDPVFLCFIAFSLLSIFSTLINGFRSRTTTAPFLSLFAGFCYLLSKSNKKMPSLLFLASYVGNFLFLVTYIITYRQELFSLNFDRLGAIFGDINDISLFMFFGFLMSLCLLAFDSRKYIKVISICLSLPYLFCGMSSGSRIFVLLIIVTVPIFVFVICGKKKWWLALIILILLGVSLIILFNLPVFSTIKNRFEAMISTLLGKSINGTTTNERSIFTRFNMFLSGFEMFLRKPAFGWGISGFAIFGDYTGGWSHNNFSESLCNFGLIGTFVFHVPIVFSFCKINYRDKVEKCCLLFLISFIICMFSVALNSEKLYAYLIGPVSAVMCKANLVINVNALHLKVEKELKNESTRIN